MQISFCILGPKMCFTIGICFRYSYTKLGDSVTIFLLIHHVGVHAIANQGNPRSDN